MNWQKLYTDKRLGSSKTQLKNENRSAFLQDYDKVVFSSQFRKLQNKTQVFPLPGAVFVHNRLTHSLEVASVGRSLGKSVGEKLCEKYDKAFSAADRKFYTFELSDVIQTACLAHDIGNPPFGHFGEVAIRTFFDKFFKEYQTGLNTSQIRDFVKFEGNANGFRIISNLFLDAGLKLTYTSLASIVKYPCDSRSGFNKATGILSTKKSGFFDTEKEQFQEVMLQLGIPKLAVEGNVFARHPFVFLVEAADDICYRIIDLEDAFSLNVINIKQALDLLLPLFEGEKSEAYIKQKIGDIEDDNQKLAFLRAMLINLLTQKCTEAFLENEELLLAGELNSSLIELLNKNLSEAIKKIDVFSFENIYNHKSVIEKELAGYHVILGLLEEFVEAMKDFSHPKSQKVLHLIPKLHGIKSSNDWYQNLIGITDFVAGMTDVFAIDLYRKLKGIQNPDFG